MKDMRVGSTVQVMEEKGAAPIAGIVTADNDDGTRAVSVFPPDSGMRTLRAVPAYDSEEVGRESDGPACWAVETPES